MKIWDNGLSYTIGKDSIPVFDEDSIGLFEPEDKYDARIMQFLKTYNTNTNVSFLKEFAHLDDDNKYAIILALEYSCCKDVFTALEKLKEGGLCYEPRLTLLSYVMDEMDYSELVPYIDFNRIEAKLKNDGVRFFREGAFYCKP